MYKKITLTLPEETIKQLNKYAPKGDRSSFVNDALNSKFTDIYVNKKLGKEKDPIQDLIDFSKRLPKVSNKNILKSIKKGRSDEHNT